MSHTNRISAFEATSFINKFKDLWNAGQQATLHFETKAGEAWATISVALGSFPNDVPEKKYVKPSQHRRRERRHAARAAEEVVQAAPPCVAEEAVSERIISDVVNNEASNNEFISKPSKAGQVPLEGNPQFIKDEIELTKMSINIEKTI